MSSTSFYGGNPGVSNVISWYVKKLGDAEDALIGEKVLLSKAEPSEASYGAVYERIKVGSPTLEEDFQFLGYFRGAAGPATAVAGVTSKVFSAIPEKDAIFISELNKACLSDYGVDSDIFKNRQVVKVNISWANNLTSPTARLMASSGNPEDGYIDLGPVNKYIYTKDPQAYCPPGQVLFIYEEY